jgi:hypothetical protein
MKHFPAVLAAIVWVLAVCFMSALGGGNADKIPVAPAGADDFDGLLERLRKDNPAEAAKVEQLGKSDRASALRFLRDRYGANSVKDSKPQQGNKEKPGAAPTAPPIEKKPTGGATLAPRLEPFEKIETLAVGEFSVDVCRRSDGAFGLGEIRHGSQPIRRPDFPVTWKVAGRAPRVDGLSGLIIRLSAPAATLTFAPERRVVAGTEFTGFSMRFTAENGPIVETASWEPGGDTTGLDYFDGYRGWGAPPIWQRAAGVPETNPKLTPSLLHGTGFQFLHGEREALIHFHTSPGDRLRNASRGRALEFETTHETNSIRRFILTTSGDSRINLWTRAFEVVQAELHGAFGLPPRPTRETWLRWPPFSRKGFQETAAECAALTEQEGFTGACIDVIWDNADFHGGKKNMNVWDYSICDGYGGSSGLKALTAACRNHGLLVNAWAPAGHLTADSPVWKAHPEWVLQNARGEPFKNPSGLLHGDLDTAFHDYFTGRMGHAVREFGLNGLWMDTHLPYAQQWHKTGHAAKLAAVYRDLIRAGARQFLVEGDASAFGGYSVAIEVTWQKGASEALDPGLFYNSSLQAGSSNPRFYLDHFRRFTAAGAAWVVDWDFLHSPKLAGPDFDAARREVLDVVKDYRRVRDRMEHRFVHADGSGYTWTNDRDGKKVVWLLKSSRLPDGRIGEVGKVYVVE